MQTTVDQEVLGIGSRVNHPTFGDGVIINIHPASYDVTFMLYGIKSVGKNYDKWEVIEAVPATGTVNFTEAEQSLIKILKNWSDISEIVPIGEKWEGGVMVLHPKDDSLKPKEIKIEAFFHKIVMLRDRLRVMEQRINSSKNLDETEKINLQQYITRIYGSLTTFNVMFKYRDDHFVGESSR